MTLNRSDVSTYQVIKKEKKLILGERYMRSVVVTWKVTDVCELIKKADLTEKNLLILK